MAFSFFLSPPRLRNLGVQTFQCGKGDPRRCFCRTFLTLFVGWKESFLSSNLIILCFGLELSFIEYQLLIAMQIHEFGCTRLIISRNCQCNCYHFVTQACLKDVKLCFNFVCFHRCGSRTDAQSGGKSTPPRWRRRSASKKRLRALPRATSRTAKRTTSRAPTAQPSACDANQPRRSSQGVSETLQPVVIRDPCLDYLHLGTPRLRSDECSKYTLIQWCKVQRHCRERVDELPGNGDSMFGSKVKK